MIRPITLVCWVLALSAGLYLYRAKHEVELMDRHIDLIAKQTAELRGESRGLLDEWIRLGEPEQLHRYSDEYLGLQPISPAQFARLSDLAARLPQPQPDPPEPQPNVVALSSGGDSPAAGVIPVDPATTGPDQEITAAADDIPVPPIPPVKVPVAAATPPAVNVVPLQARPVTPRLADRQTEPEPARTHTGTLPPGGDEVHVGTAKVAPIEPNSGSSGATVAQARNSPGLPPLQALETRDAAAGRVTAQAVAAQPVAAQGQAFGRISGQATPRPMESRTAEMRRSDPPREIRPSEPPPVQHLAAERRYPEPPVRQGPSQTEHAQVGPPPGGSLLGMSRSSVPLPLPAPTPVNAAWSGPSGPGSGR